MNWRAAIGLLAFLALASCASEGGSRGSGISTAVLGNVASVQSAAAAAPAARLGAALTLAAPAYAQGAVEGIRVTVEGTAAEAETDENGRFSLTGDFEGRLILVFQLADDAAAATVPINVPAAGTLTLNNVIVDTRTGEASAERQDVSFEGIVTSANCQNLTLAMMSVQQSPTDVDLYSVQLDTSTVEDAQGNVLRCEDLYGGARALLQGTVNTDGSFGHATIQLED